MPDGTLLFSDLGLSLARESVGLVGRNGSGKSTLLAAIAGQGGVVQGTITCRGKVGFLRQLPPVGMRTVGDLLGGDALACLERIERGTASDEDHAQADWTLPSRLDAALASVGLAPLDSDRPLAGLSGGERMRVMLAALLLDDTDVLLLDEPTNNLDDAGRDAVIDLIGRWHGPVLVASHDRALLEHVDRIVELTQAGIHVVGGGWSAFEQQRGAQRAQALQTLEKAEAAVKTARRERQREAEKQARRDKRGRAFAARASEPKILLHARQQRAEQTAAHYRAVGDGSVEQAGNALAKAQADVERLVPIRIALPSCGLPPRHVLVEARQVACARGGRHLFGPLDLTVRGPERIALTGPNGSGKTSLIRLLQGEEEPQAGSVAADRKDIVLLDQHLSLLERSESALEAMRRHNPQMEAGQAHDALAVYGFRNRWGDRTVESLSGGERVRLALACLFARPRPPRMLILDEPTNHLDVDATMLLEEALRAYDGAILCVSHDRGFREALKLEREIVLP
jgi:ATPase subunit of ABC transporter with duplicated ATPase domains